MSKPSIEWLFSVKSNNLLPRSIESIDAPINADVHKLRQQLMEIGYRDIYLAGKRWEKYAWPGGYPLFLGMRDGGCLCIACTENDRYVRQVTMDPTLDDPQWNVDCVEINWEDDLYCDHCNKKIESAYGSDED